MPALPEPIDLSSSSCTSWVYAHGAHLVDWTPAGGSAVLWLSPRATFDAESAIRGGVPIVFPWFGSGTTGSMSPAHGFGRLSDWRLASVERESDAMTATFLLDSSWASSELFPHPYRAEYVIRSGDHLALCLTVVNTGPTTFAFEEALHAYLAVGDVGRVRVEGLDGAEYVDKVAGPSSPRPVQDGPLAVVGETDRVYRSARDIRVVDPVLGRTLVVRTTGARSIIVWNPGATRAAAPSAADIGPDHWREFVCVEGGNVMDDAVVLAAGESSTMTYTVHVEPLASSAGR